MMEPHMIENYIFSVFVIAFNHVVSYFQKVMKF